MSSQIVNPGIRVLIGWKGPRTSRGAAGFMSNVSDWGKPPGRYTMLTECSVFPLVALAFAARQPASERPQNPRPSPSLPIRRKPHRDSPSQNTPCWRPRIVNTDAILPAQNQRHNSAATYSLTPQPAERIRENGATMDAVVGTNAIHKLVIVVFERQRLGHLLIR